MQSSERNIVFVGSVTRSIKGRPEPLRLTQKQELVSQQPRKEHGPNPNLLWKRNRGLFIIWENLLLVALWPAAVYSAAVSSVLKGFPPDDGNFTWDGTVSSCSCAALSLA